MAIESPLTVYAELMEGIAHIQVSKNKRLTAQRDALLAALREILTEASRRHQSTESKLANIIAWACAAIAQAEEEQCP